MTEGPIELLDQTEFAQPAIFATSYLAYLSIKDSLFNSQSPCKYVIGHSVGEFTALTIGGYLDPLDTIKALRFRGKLMQKCCEGRKCGMLVVLDSELKASNIFEKIKEDENLNGKICELAVYNSYKNHIFTGDIEILSSFAKALKKERILNVFLKVSAAFHCSILSPMIEPFGEFLKNIPISKGSPEISIIRNYDLKEIRTKEDIFEGLIKQLTNPVKFYQSVLKVLHSDEIDRVYEVASGKVIRRVLEGIFKHEELAGKIQLISI